MSGGSVSRRGLLSGAVLVSASMLMTGASATSATRHEVAAAPWELLHGMPGVCVKTGGYPWDRKDDLLAAMKEGGFQWMRSNQIAGAQKDLAFYGSAGIKLQLIAGDPLASLRPAAQVQAAIDGGLIPYVLGFEGANEWNLKERPAWVEELLLHQTELYRAVKSNPITRGCAVIAPALGMVKDYELWGFRAELMNAGNTHIYSGGYPPEQKAWKSVYGPRLNCGELPVILTETGWHTTPSWTGNHYPTPASVARTYAPRTLAEYFRLGTPRLSFYQLANSGPNSGEREDNFGLLDYNLRPKEHFYALANFNRIVAGAAGSGTVSSLPRTILGPEDVRTVAVRGPAGRYQLLVWRDTQIWDPIRQRPMTVGSQQVTVDWGATRAVTTYWPSRSASPADQGHERATSLKIGAELAILSVTS